MGAGCGIADPGESPSREGCRFLSTRVTNSLAVKGLKGIAGRKGLGHRCTGPFYAVRRVFGIQRGRR